MGKSLFSDAEKYLIERWQDVYDVNTCVDDIRGKHSSLLEKVVEEVKDRHSEITEVVLYPTIGAETRHIGFGKDQWGGKKPWISGIWIEEIGIDSLLTPDNAGRPNASIWFDSEGKAAQSSKDCVKAVKSAFEVILTPEEKEFWNKGSDPEIGLCFTLPETKKDFQEMLLEADGQRFVDCIVKHFESLFRFIKAIDKGIAVSRGS